ncbi:MAG: hypothetical protein DWQ31_09435 [Planctomycetota bacterium]|nr:MAG: hypothetical protein DWQ31_09435 [Planctomycetota bacterium]REJ96528.1 MAG: hypothetical protein DWQ35_04070 [Planctomycetota bacterium]REK21789.1 MAG: hypothetical protein DWQ42_19100 [Planctomycetota bacterium]REK43194.1 MAG: hypothetical protein DWQ46_12540 [Planctomycetota bacterium]
MSHPQRLSQYRVQLGHAHVEVESDSPELALGEARRRLSLEYPRLWDVIHETDVTQFRIDPAH